MVNDYYWKERTYYVDVEKNGANGSLIVYRDESLAFHAVFHPRARVDEFPPLGIHGVERIYLNAEPKAIMGFRLIQAGLNEGRIELSYLDDILSAKCQ